MRRLGLFAGLTIASGAAAITGALLGAELLAGDALDGDVALFGSGTMAGALAVLGATHLAVRLRCLPSRRHRAVRTGALVGLLVAVAASFFTAWTFVGPVLAFAFVGIGAVVADVDAADGERRARSVQ